MQKDLRLDIKFLALRSVVYADKKKVKGLIFKEGDLVYLIRRNIKTKRPSNKLDYTKPGPFRIKRVKGKLNYEL